MRAVLLLLPVVACEFRPSDLVAIDGAIENQSDATIAMARTYLLDGEDIVDADDCVNRLVSHVLPGDVGDIRWPPLSGAQSWAIEIVLEPGGCLVLNHVSRDGDIVVPQDPDLKGWHPECQCEGADS
ncbi:MAG: hypothetical protein KTR31_04630 [Myxococcales bacterium]|nr:hypothetical protein [Myxococcales bacterium]